MEETSEEYFFSGKPALFFFSLEGVILHFLKVSELNFTFKKYKLILRIYVDTVSKIHIM